MSTWGLFLLSVLAPLCFAAGPQCEEISEYSPCKSLLNYTNVTITGPCLVDQDFLINSSTWIWAVVRETCRNPLAQLMCMNTYPTCSGLKPCRSVCDKFSTACQSDIPLLQFVQESMGGFPDCSTFPTTNCYDPYDALDEEPVPVAHCENYTGTICSNWVGYPVYIPYGWTQDKLEETAKQVSGILGLVDQTCRDSMGKWACHQAFMPCNDTQVTDILGIPNPTYKAAFPSFPCQSTCQTYIHDCADFVHLDPRLEANCSATGTFAGGQRCGLPSSVEDWPAESNLLGVIKGELIETPCNGYEQTASAQVSCFLPFVKPDGENGGIIRRFFPDSVCDLPCPASFLFSEDQWKTLTDAMGITYISFFLNLFLAITWRSFQHRKSQVYVARFLTLTTLLSAVLCLGFWAIPSHAPKRDLRYLQCADNVSSYPMGFNFCTFQAIAIYWLTLSLAGWWFIIGFDAYRSAVLDEKLSHDGLKRKRMQYHILGWGLPSFSLFFFLACGGKLGGDNETALVFCFVGNRSIRETGEWLDYFSFFMPLIIYIICGCYFITRISYTTIKSARKTRSNKSQTMLYSQIVRMSSFLIIFLFVFFWVFTYRIGISEYRDPLIMAGFTWARCHFETLGDFSICGDRPKTDLSFDAQLGFHVVLAMSGIWVFLVWGTDRKVYMDWKVRLQNATWKDLVLCKPVRDKGLQHSHTPSGASSGTSGTTQHVDPIRSSEMSTDTTDEFTGTSTDAVPTMNKSMSMIMPGMVGWRRFINIAYWTQLVTIPRVKRRVRRYKIAMFAFLVFLFFLILLIALVADTTSNATYQLPAPLAINVKNRGKSLPTILIQSVDFLSLNFYATAEDRTHVNSVVRVKTNNPCGKFCPITVESMSLSMNLLIEGLSVGWMRMPGKNPVKLIKNADGTYDPVVFDAEVTSDIMLEMSEVTNSSWAVWETQANANWDHYNDTARPGDNTTWRQDPACPELTDGRSCATYGCRWVVDTCEGPSLLAELVPVRPGSPRNMIKMMGQFLSQPNVTLGLHGLAAARAFKLDIGDIGINLNTVVKASNGLMAQIFTLDIPSNAPGGGLTLNVDMNVVNPSIGSIPEIGDMVFEVRSGNITIGDMFVPNSTLFSGDNLLSGSGVIWPKDNVSKVECEKMMSAYLSGTTQYLTAKGLGQHPRSRYPVKWFGDLVSTMTLTIPMAGRLVNAMSNVTINRVTLDFQMPGNPQAVMTVSSQVDFPFKFPMTLDKVDVDYTLQLEANIAIDSASYGTNCACLPPSCICAMVGEDETLDLRCPDPSHVISVVLFASYGEPNGTCGNFVRGDCDAPNTLSQMSTRCVGSNRCTVPNATDTLNPHTCNDTLSKKLYVNVRCATTVNVGLNVTSAVRARCNGADNCEIPMDVATLGPDPFVGCDKVLNVTYRCTNPKYGLLYKTFMVANGSHLYSKVATVDCEGPPFAKTSANVGLNPPIPLVNGRAMITMAANNSFTVLNATLFGEYVVEIVTGNSTVRSIVGIINATAQTVIGEFKVSGLRLNTQFFVAGMKGFPGLSISKLDVLGGRPGELDLLTTNSINNTASITAFMGQVGFTIWYKNIYCGNITHSAFSLYPGMNSVNIPGFYAEKTATCKELLTNYLNVRTSAVVLKGEASLTANQYLKLAFTPALTLNANFPGMTLPRMITKTYARKPSSPFSTSFDARMRVQNRFSAQIAITRVVQTMNLAGSSTVLGTIDDTRTNPIILAPNQESVTDTVPAQGEISFAGIGFLYVSGGGKIDVTGQIGIGIGSYSGLIDYAQTNLDCEVNNDCISNPANCN